MNVKKEYKKLTNITCSELKRWKNNPCSNKAGLNSKPINRNIRLLCKKKWDNKDIQEAKKTISFIKRMSKVKKGKIVCGGLSKRDISLKNWAYKIGKEK